MDVNTPELIGVPAQHNTYQQQEMPRENADGFGDLYETPNAKRAADVCQEVPEQLGGPRSCRSS